MPKFKNLNNKDLENDKLQRWLMFLRNDISESELEELIDMDNDIKAEERLEYLSSDLKLWKFIGKEKEHYMRKQI